MLPTPLFGPVPGGMEMMVILLIAVLLFGANKLPKLARSTGQAMGEFKKGREDIERELRESAEGVERAGGTDDALDDETANV
ncbi:twin-arginine translocase TatA/TatE family subunit [Halorussus gelatinilyticus]|uniref:Twin-arginine translocase TatA/TatE family subunit n=1 Tax=Halorussus gelatinilyticus TaxID=2937524 RepID=A0A8U0IFD9_9EURY|nr:twin-arginine translocase TatA/TatE family subunit [Halorussus gelatinilyticus]UPV99786.1 twin-arginine translocase TatA/TatE family subunit [Halorussus gelatinilyticus]